jgi:hypothetical protein
LTKAFYGSGIDYIDRETLMVFSQPGHPDADVLMPKNKSSGGSIALRGFGIARRRNPSTIAFIPEKPADQGGDLRWIVLDTTF